MATLPSPAWHLKERMAVSGIVTAPALRSALAKAGVSLSLVQVARLVRRPPARLSLEQLGALCHILHCAPGDLLTVTLAQKAVATPAPTALSTIPSTEPRPARLTTMSESDRARILGPKARALAAHPLARERP